MPENEKEVEVEINIGNYEEELGSPTRQINESFDPLLNGVISTED